MLSLTVKALFTVDIDECSSQPGLCNNGTCENTDGRYRCHCHPGFRLTTNQDCEGKAWVHKGGRGDPTSDKV